MPIPKVTFKTGRNVPSTALDEKFSEQVCTWSSARWVGDITKSFRVSAF